MKNKKLFAILTLVCFMFTLMPVAAFAVAPAPIAANVYAQEVAADGTPGNFTDEATVAKLGAFNVMVGTTTTSGVSTDYYVYYAVNEDGEGVAVAEGTGTTASLTIQVPGDYKVYAAALTGTGEADSVLDSIDTVANKVAKIQSWAVSSNRVVDEYATVSVEAPEFIYKVELATSAKDDYVANSDWTVVSAPASVGGKDYAAKYSMEIEASEGFVKNGKVVATVTKSSDNGANWTVVKGQEVTISEAGYVDVAYDTLTTNNKGQVVFVVTSDLANEGNKVIVKYAKAKAELTVDSVAAAVTTVTLNNAPKTPQNNDNEVEKANVEFKFTDANGVAGSLTTASRIVTDADVAITLVEKPAKSTMKSSDFKLIKQDGSFTGSKADTAGVYTLKATTTGEKFDKDGTYVVKVALKNGSSATATIEVAEMGDVVAIMFADAPKTVAYGEKVSMDYVVAVDAKGVTEAVTPDAFSASGLAADKFVVTMAGMSADLTAKNDDKYIGETITVMAVYDDFTVTTDVVVVDQAATIKLVSTEAEVGISTKLVGRIIDATGKSTTIDENGAVTVKAIVLDKPENAVAVVSPVNPAGLVEHNALINFMASAPGEYKVQTIVTYTLPGVDNNYATTADNVVKYISGIETITVGGGMNAFDDVVVLSMGAKSMIVNDEVVALDVAPFVAEGRTMMQYTALKAFGIEFNWDGVDTVTAEGNGVKVVMTIGSKVATVNGKVVNMEVAPTIIDGRTVIPVTYATNPFGITATALYDANGVSDVLFTK